MKRTAQSFSSALFLDVANASCSQMAEGLARRLFGPAVRVQSAGSTPARVHPLAIRVMDELGIDLRSQRAKAIAEVETSTVDLVITLSPEDVCPESLRALRRFHWPVRDPASAEPGLTEAGWVERFRAARDEIDAHLEGLLTDAPTLEP